MTPIRLIHLMMFLPFTCMLAGRMVITLYALELGASAFVVGVIAAMNQVFGLLLAYPVGVIQDRHGARGMFVFGALAGGAGLALPWLFPGMLSLYAASVLLGLWGVIQVVPVQSLMAVVSPPERVARDLSHLNTLAWLTAVIGPLVAGLAVDALGHGLASLALLPLVLATLGAVARWGRLLPRGQRGRGPAAGLGDALRDRALRPMFMLSMLVQIAMDLFPFFLPLVGHERGLSASAIGTVTAISAIGAIPSALILPQLGTRASGMVLLGGSFVLCALSYLLLPLSGGMALLVAASLVYGLGIGGAHSLVSLLMFRRAPKERIGAIMGTRMMLNHVVKVIGPAAFGGLAGALGLASAPLAAGGLLGCAGWVLLRRPRRVP